MSSVRRFRKFALITYVSYEKIMSVVLQVTNIRDYAFIYHDKDTDDKGNLITPHWHIFLYLSSARPLSTVRNYFADNDAEGRPITTLAQSCNDSFRTLEYLTHENHPDKHHYSAEEVRTNLTSFEDFNLDSNESDNTYDILRDMLTCESLTNLVKVYGKDLVYHYRQFKDIIYDIKYNGDKPNFSL